MALGAEGRMLGRELEHPGLRYHLGVETETRLPRLAKAPEVWGVRNPSAFSMSGRWMLSCCGVSAGCATGGECAQATLFSQ